MTRRQFAVVLAVVAVAGLVGGALSGWLTGRPAFAQADGLSAAGAYELQTVTGDGGRPVLLLVDTRNGTLWSHMPGGTDVRHGKWALSLEPAE
jgi:hypothetical protein